MSAKGVSAKGASAAKPLAKNSRLLAPAAQTSQLPKDRAKGVDKSAVKAASSVAIPPVIKPNHAMKPVAAMQPAAAKSVVKSGRPSSNFVSKAEPYHMPMQPAVATNLKPRKSQIGLGVKELEHFADMLLAKRRELVGDMSSMEREALRTGGSSNLSTLPIHMADMGTDNYEQEFTLGLVEKDRNLLREINNALAKIQNGSYGICEGTGKPIGKPRLEVQPWARFGIEYARMREKNGMGVRTF